MPRPTTNLGLSKTGVPQVDADLDRIDAVLAGGTGFRQYWVDNNRTDSYTPCGSQAFPFKTIMSAVNKVIANGDNASVLYVIAIAPGTYAETVDVGNAALLNIGFVGPIGHANSGSEGWVQITGSGGVELQSLANNTGQSVQFTNIKFFTGTTLVSINAASSSSYYVFENCLFGSGAFTVTGGCNTELRNCYGRPTITHTGGVLNMIGTTWTSGSTTLASAATLTCEACCIYGNHNVTVPSGCVMNFRDGCRMSSSCTLTVNSGGTLSAQGASLNGTNTFQAGSTCELHNTYLASFTGTISSAGVFPTNQLLLAAAAPTVAAAQVGLGATTATTATTGANGAVPAQVDGYLIINVAGTVKKIPYYNT